jgi:hypothetical protein
MPIRYRNVISCSRTLSTPAFTSTAKARSDRDVSMGGRARATATASRIGTWEVLIRDHHEGYIDWAEYERNQKPACRQHLRSDRGAKSGRGGRALLSGMLTCARCGRRLAVAYTGSATEPADLSLRQAQPHDGLAALHDLRRPRVDAAIARRTAGGRTDGDRGGVGGRADAQGTTGRAPRILDLDLQQAATTPRSPSAATPPAIPTTD